MKRGIILISVGLLLVLAAIFCMIRFALLEQGVGSDSEQILTQLQAAISVAAPKERFVVSVPTQPVGGSSDSEAVPTETKDALPQTMPTQTIDGVAYLGILRIPALQLTLPVTADCCDDTLEISPGRYSGTPGGNDLVIAGHNYKKQFKSIDTLNPGDAITLTDAGGFLYSYTVSAIQTLGATAVEEMVNSGYPLTLFSCTNDGIYRIAVRCSLLRINGAPVSGDPANSSHPTPD